MDDLVLLSLTETRRKRKLHEVRETVQFNSRRLDDQISLAKSLQKVLGDGAVYVGVFTWQSLVRGWLPLVGETKALLRGNLECTRGKSMKEAAKPVTLTVQ